jgi:UrcA family protein
MDTTIASPKFASSNRTSPKTSSILAVALSIGVCAWLVAVTAGMAHAETAPQTAARVTYADLDVSTADGARALLGRIDIAARAACGVKTHSPLLPHEAGYHRACVANAVDAAVRQIGSPILAELHNQSPASVTLAAR